VAWMTKYYQQTGDVYVSNPRHRCTPTCDKFVHGCITVCKQGLHTHRCGRACSQGADRREGVFCVITGAALGAIEVQFATTSRRYGARCMHNPPPPPPLTGCYCLGGVWMSTSPPVPFTPPPPHHTYIPSRPNDTSQHWSGTPTKRRKTAPSERAATIVSDILSAINTIFHSPKRAELVDNAIRKVTVDAARVMRAAVQLHRPIPITHAMALLLRVVADKQRSIMLVTAPATHPRMQSLAHDLAKYLIEQRRARPNQITNMVVYTVALLGLLRVGITHDGVVLVPCVPWIVECSPDDNQYCTIEGVESRAVTFATRHLKSIMVSGSGHPVVTSRLRLSPASLL
jgi:hypothetical protein